MLNGLDLFSGIGGISLALSPWVRTVAYCERDRYARAVLLSRMHDGRLHRAPIWDDVQTLTGSMLPPIDIIFGGFPCQDISCAGNGVGLAGERSGLFFEIMRLAEEIKPSFIFLENVPAIRTRGLDRVGLALADRGYDCRWCALSAQEVGANHKRNRWFLLAANSERIGLREQSRGSRGQSGQETTFARIDGEARSVANANGEGQLQQAGLEREGGHGFGECGNNVANTESIGRREGWAESARIEGRLSASCGGVADTECNGLEKPRETITDAADPSADTSWWATEPDVGRVVNGLPQRVDRIRCLGNAVVPLQAQTAFKRLMGMT